MIRTEFKVPTPIFDDETPPGSVVADSPVDILIVEDNINDVELTTHALKDLEITNRIKAVCDGAEALDFIFCQVDYRNRDPNTVSRS
jgi:hypothetical protein